MAPPDRDLQHITIESSGEAQLAAILILLYVRNGTFYTVFIKRTKYPGPHSGQISFPGGKTDPEDMDLSHTAIREAREEIGIDPSKLQIIGKLSPLFIPVSNFIVHPYIGFQYSLPRFKIQASEVQFLLDVELIDLLKPKTHAFMDIIIQGREIKVPCYGFKDHRIWGATAMILSEFLELVKRTGFSSGQ